MANIATSEKIRIRLKAYDHVVLDQSAEKIVDSLMKLDLPAGVDIEIKL